MAKLILLLAILSFYAKAEPELVEIWFLSEKKTAINTNIFPIRTIATTVQVPDNIPCTPYGDGCFHPQYGYYEKKSGKVKADHSKLEENKPNPISNEHLSNLNSDLIKCDKDNHFDFFCGKAKPIPKNQKKNYKLEVWVDISSSLKGIDYSEDGQCNRGSFVKRLRNQCGNKVKFSVFDTGIRELSQASIACEHVGLNDTDRIIKWIDANESKRLVIITDISEYKMKLADYLSTINSKIRGEIPRAELVSSELLAQVDRLKNYCR